MDPNSTVIPSDVWMRIVTSARVEADGNVRILSDGLAAMCRAVDDFRGISKESNAKTRVKNPRTIKGKNSAGRPNLADDEDLSIRIYRTLRENPNLSNSALAQAVGIGKNQIDQNPRLYEKVEAWREEFHGHPKFDNDRKRRD